MEFSVCIPVHNEEKSLPRLLNWLLQNEQDIPEILVVSDGSTDRTNQILKEYASKFAFAKKPFRVFIRPKRLGKTDAINFLLKQARHDVFVLISGDILPTRESLRNLVKRFKDKKVGAVSGHPIIVNNPKTLADHIGRRIHGSQHLIRTRQMKKGQYFNLLGDMIAWRKSILPFLEYNSVLEDAYIGLAIKRKGFKVVYAEDVTYYKKCPSAISEWIEERRRIMLGKIHLEKNYGVEGFAFFEVSPISLLKCYWKAVENTPKSVAAFFLSAIMEVWIRIYCTFEYKVASKTHRIWNVIESSKW